MIKALSPYYVSVPWVAPLSGETATQFTLNIYVWSGLKSDVPTTPTYQVIKDNATSSTDTIEINIANWIADFIDFTPQEGSTTELIDGDNQYWIKWETFYETDTPTDATTPTNENVKLFLRGYSYGLDGENATVPANKILIPIQDYKVSEGSKFVVPIVIDETVVTPPETILNSVTALGSEIYEYDFTMNDFIGNVFLIYRQQGDTNWISSERYFVSSDGTFVVNSLEIPLTGNVEFAIKFFYSIGSELIYSNVITLTI